MGFHKNGGFGSTFVTGRSCASPISKVKRHISERLCGAFWRNVNFGQSPRLDWCERLALVPVAVQLLVSTLKAIRYSVRIALASVIAGCEKRQKNFIRKPDHKRRRKYFSVVLTLKDAAGAAGCRLELQWSDKTVVSGPEKITGSQQ